MKAPSSRRCVWAGALGFVRSERPRARQPARGGAAEWRHRRRDGGGPGGRDYPEITPRLARDYLEVTPRLPEITQRLPRDYPEVTPRPRRGYPEISPRLARGYPRCTRGPGGKGGRACRWVEKGRTGRSLWVRVCCGPSLSLPRQCEVTPTYLPVAPPRSGQGGHPRQARRGAPPRLISGHLGAPRVISGDIAQPRVTSGDLG